MSFSKGGERISGPTPMMMMMVIMPQDEWPWTGRTLPLVDSFLQGRSGMSRGDKMLTSQDVTWRTVSSTAREEQKIGSRMEPLIAA